MAEPSFDLDSAHRWFGIELNNRTMDALEAGHVTPETAESHIHAAHASCHHWMQVGTAANHGRGEFAVARAFAACGEMGTARRVREEARISGEAIAGEEDRLYFMGWLEGGNWHGLDEG